MNDKDECGASGSGKSRAIWSRRAFLQSSAMGVAGLAAAAARGQSPMPALASGTPSGNVAAGGGGEKPNIIFISADQLGIEAISAHGCPYISTPNIDRLVQSGVSFQQSYTANPLCSPARSTWFTGRMSSETGVTVNGRAIRPGMATMGEVLRSGGYETYYCGKWHLPIGCVTTIPGFRVLPAGINLDGEIGDTAVSQACAALLANRGSKQPFLMVTAFLQPHDICNWIGGRSDPDAWTMPAGLKESQLPELPPNFHFDKREPMEVKTRRPDWSHLQWRYYLWCYYRHVEMVDAEVGRVLDALESSPHARNTVVIFASDHGEGQARHQKYLKNFLYDEAARVPFVISWPGRVAQGVKDATHLTSSTDILPTMCDYAGVATPERVVGRSVRPLLEGKKTVWRDMVAGEVVKIGRMVRTDQYKYITYRRDSVEQLFDMGNDPWETKNLAGEAGFASVLNDHHKMLAEWESRLDRAPEEPRKSRSLRQKEKRDAESDTE